MKKLVSLFLAAALLLAAPTAALAADGADLVTDAYSAQFDFSGNVCDYHIPQINMSGAGVTALNAIIWRDIYDGCVAEIEYMARDSYYEDYWPGIMGVDYHWARNGDVLSIWVRLQGDTDNDQYYVYNMSLSSGEQISNADLLQAAGVTREQFNDLLRTVLSDRLDQTRAYMSEDYMEMMGKDALSDRNLGMAMPYLGMGGSLCTVAWVYTPAGAGRYLETLTLVPGDMESQLINFIENCDRQYFTENDIEGFTKEMCVYARNGVYARSGRGFSDQGLLDYFLQFSWYSPDIPPEQFSDSYLNEYQTQNVALVLAYEQAHGYL